MNPVSIVDLTEDLVSDEAPQAVVGTNAVKRNPKKSKKDDSSTINTLELLVKETAIALKIDVRELLEWQKASIAPEAVIQSILKTAKHWLLNPALGHIDWSHHPDLGYEVFLSIDGWISLIQRDPRFRGIAFQESREMDQGIPIWMECSIYRSDLITPITIREYFVELKTDHPIWSEMPRRMMRHRSMQQCARLTFGIHLSETQISEPMGVSTKKVNAPPPSVFIDPKQKLKDKLYQMP